MPAPITRLTDGRFQVLGTTRVSDVNGELGLELPEQEDFETLAGFVLAELGRFPRKGEGFEKDGVDAVRVEAREGGLSVGRGQHLVTLVLEDHPERVADARIVVNYQDPSSHRWRH